MRVCIYAYIYICIYIYISVCVCMQYVCIQCIHTYIHTHLPTYLTTYHILAPTWQRPQTLHGRCQEHRRITSSPTTAKEARDVKHSPWQAEAKKNASQLQGELSNSVARQPSTKLYTQPFHSTHWLTREPLDVSAPSQAAWPPPSGSVVKRKALQ